MWVFELVPGTETARVHQEIHHILFRLSCRGVPVKPERQRRRHEEDAHGHLEDIVNDEKLSVEVVLERVRAIWVIRCCLFIKVYFLKNTSFIVIAGRGVPVKLVQSVFCGGGLRKGIGTIFGGSCR